MALNLREECNLQVFESGLFTNFGPKKNEISDFRLLRMSGERIT
jgi:hypothetical protein